MDRVTSLATSRPSTEPATDAEAGKQIAAHVPSGGLNSGQASNREDNADRVPASLHGERCSILFSVAGTWKHTLRGTSSMSVHCVEFNPEQGVIPRKGICVARSNAAELQSFNAGEH